MATDNKNDDVKQKVDELGIKFFKAKSVANSSDMKIIQKQIQEILLGDLDKLIRIHTNKIRESFNNISLEKIRASYQENMMVVLNRFFTKKEDIPDSFYSLYCKTINYGVRDSLLRELSETKTEYYYKRNPQKAEKELNTKSRAVNVPPTRTAYTITDDEGNETNILDTIKDDSNENDLTLNICTMFNILLDAVEVTNRKYAESSKTNWTELFFTENAANISETGLPIVYLKRVEKKIARNINDNFFITFMNGNCENAKDLLCAQQIQPLSEITKDLTDNKNWVFPAPSKIYLTYFKSINKAVTLPAVSQNRAKYNKFKLLMLNQEIIAGDN